MGLKIQYLEILQFIPMQGNISSLLSPQSFTPLQVVEFGTHRLFAQENWFSRQRTSPNTILKWFSTVHYECWNKFYNFVILIYYNILLLIYRYLMTCSVRGYMTINIYKLAFFTAVSHLADTMRNSISHFTLPLIITRQCAIWAEIRLTC